MGRYNSRRYGRGYRGQHTSISLLVVIILLAVATGYAGTKYVIYPYLLNGQTEQGQSAKDTAGTPQTATGGGVNAITSVPGVIVDQQNIANEGSAAGDKADPAKTPPATPPADKTQPVGTPEQNTQSAGGAYALQFGSFTEKGGASQHVSELLALGINAYIFEYQGNFRVLGNTYDSKEKANQAAQIIKGNSVEVFVVDMKTIM